jgi:hypothetical protein
MRNVRMLPREPNFVSSPVEKAIYCENCETVSNSTMGCCGECGSEAILRLAALIDGPPSGPDSGPVPAGCVVSTLQWSSARAA